MAYKVQFAAEAKRDFELIFDFLVESYIAFGEDAGSAIDRAELRVQAIRADAESIALAPYQGTLHDDVLPGLRNVTKGRAVIWFDVSETPKRVRILAVFFGGQDHRRHMLARLLG